MYYLYIYNSLVLHCHVVINRIGLYTLACVFYGHTFEIYLGFCICTNHCILHLMQVFYSKSIQPTMHLFKKKNYTLDNINKVLISICINMKIIWKSYNFLNPEYKF